MDESQHASVRAVLVKFNPKKRLDYEVCPVAADPPLPGLDTVGACQLGKQRADKYREVYLTIPYYSDDQWDQVCNERLDEWRQAAREFWLQSTR